MGTVKRHVPGAEASHRLSSSSTRKRQRRAEELRSSVLAERVRRCGGTRVEPQRRSA